MAFEVECSYLGPLQVLANPLHYILTVELGPKWEVSSSESLREKLSGRKNGVCQHQNTFKTTEHFMIMKEAREGSVQALKRELNLRSCQ